jgi:hypothetical protein
MKNACNRPMLKWFVEYPKNWQEHETYADVTRRKKNKESTTLNKYEISEQSDDHVVGRSKAVSSRSDLWVQLPLLVSMYVRFFVFICPEA